MRPPEVLVVCPRAVLSGQELLESVLDGNPPTPLFIVQGRTIQPDPSCIMYYTYYVMLCINTGRIISGHNTAAAAAAARGGGGGARQRRRDPQPHWHIVAYLFDMCFNTFSCIFDSFL